MAYGRYGTSYLLLRVSLASLLIWLVAAIWIRVPTASLFLLSNNNDRIRIALCTGGIIAALSLLTNRWTRIAATATAAYSAYILIRSGRQFAAFSVLALFWLSLILLFWPPLHRPHHWWQWKKRHRDDLGYEG